MKLTRIARSSLTDTRSMFARMIDAGVGSDRIMKSLGLGRSTFFKWKKLYVAGGLDALAVAEVERSRSYALTDGQLAQLVSWLSHKNPDQFQFDFQLWTRKIVAQLLVDRFDVRMTPQGVGKLLRRLGFSPQRPLFRAVRQDPVEVERWRRLDYPAIARYAKKRDAAVYFADEASVRSDHHAGTTWARRGRTPVLADSGERVTVNMVSAVSPLGELKFRTLTGRFTSVQFIEFLDALAAGNDGRPLFVICDNSRVHKSKAVLEWLTATGHDIEIFFLPPYAPELNADEWVWNNLKNHTVGRAPIYRGADLHSIVEKGLRELAAKVETVEGFFRDRKLRYILDAHNLVH